MSKKIAVTTGDIDGVGLEVALKALSKLGPQKGIQFILFRSESAKSSLFKNIDKKFNRIVVDSLQEALEIKGDYLIDIESSDYPAKWVEVCAKLCKDKKISALVTGPLSKTGIRDSGLKDLGHTDILKRISKSKDVHMGFIGKYFNVVLATAHIPLSSVPQKLTLKSLASALWNANQLRKSLSSSHKKLPIGVLGLNPHSGEAGLIGKEELRLFSKLQAFANESRIPMEGPLVPDAAFFKSNWKKYSTFLALYHDQGLIPFKMIHGQDSGVHVTLGIPFIRTSVDHGTAKDIFGKNRANPNSMLDALSWAVKFCSTPTK